MPSDVRILEAVQRDGRITEWRCSKSPTLRDTMLDAPAKDGEGRIIASYHARVVLSAPYADAV